MALPNDAKIEDLAKVFGVSTRGLTPAARRLTKGDLVKIWGGGDDRAVLTRYAQHGQPKPTEVQASMRTAGPGLQLTVEDIHSVEAVFGSPIIPQDRLSASPSLQSIYACCCPCCCASAVLEPGPLPSV